MNQSHSSTRITSNQFSTTHLCISYAVCYKNDTVTTVNDKAKESAERFPNNR